MSGPDTRGNGFASGEHAQSARAARERRAAGQPGGAPPAPPGGFVTVGRAGLPRQRPPIARSRDREITAAGLGLALLFLLAALAALALPEDVRRGYWLPLHLALAGSATTAIAAVLPFFTTALASAPPAPPALRIAAIALVASGAGAVTAGVVGGSSGGPETLAPLGGVLFVSGVAVLGAAAFWPLRLGLGSRRGVITAAYATALVDVGIGATIATLFVGGYLPILEAWASLKPVHVWLNLFGFASLVIAATLIHLYPTVLGTRIGSGRGVVALVAGLGFGAPLTAAGYLLGSDVVARAGALIEVAGAVALAMYAASTWRARGRWTTDAGWHLITSGHLSGAVAWFALAIMLAALRVVAFGASPAGWSLATVISPIVAGWVVHSLLGAATHLVPAIGPGGPVGHRWQRQLLGRAATLRLGSLEVATAILSVAVPLGAGWPSVVGLSLGGAAVLSDVALLAVAALAGRAHDA